MDRCTRCSRGPKSIYHVGECPKGPIFEIPLINPRLKCEICKRSAVGVASSPMGAISHAYCSECIQLNREVWSTLVGGLFGVHNKEGCAEWVYPIIKATCKFYNKTEDDLWAEVKQLELDYAADFVKL